jgi:anti-anti-sigma regulatory factor
MVFMQVLTRIRYAMSTTLSHPTLQLHAGDPAAPAQIAEAVAQALAADATRPRLSVVLDGERLASETIAALVAGLRAMRERGGAIEAVPATPEIRDALALTGLDRVFAFPLDDEAAHRPRRSRGIGRFGIRAAAFGAAAVLGLLGVGRVPASAAAPHPTDPEQILSRVIERNPDLSTYQGRMHVDLRMTSFPFLSQHLDASTYFKRPGNYEVVFDRLPAYAQGFGKIFTDLGDPTNWQRRFRITYEGEQPVHGHDDVTLRLVQRVRGMIDHETVLIDPVAWTIDSIRYDYYNGGHITMTQTFRQVGPYTLLAEADAEIAIPHVRALAHGTYSDYKTNVAVDDTVFSKKN